MTPDNINRNITLATISKTSQKALDLKLKAYNLWINGMSIKDIASEMRSTYTYVYDWVMEIDKNTIAREKWNY